MKIPLVDLRKRYDSVKAEVDLAIKNVIDNTSFINGPDIKELEKEFASYCGAKQAIGCANGTVAVELALKAVGVKPGDEVITVPNTFIATTESVTHIGAKTKFVDVHPDTMLMDVSQVERLITPKTKAIIPVHLYGQMADMKELKEIADKHNLSIIEDTAQAHAAEHYGKRSPYCDVATFSFFPAKIIGAFGDAGMVVANNDEVVEKVRMLADHGRIDKYEHKIEGHNYRLDTMHAAIIKVMLHHLDEWVMARRRKAELYNELLKGLKLVTPAERSYNKHSYYMYVIKTEKRNELIEYLKNKGVSTGIHYSIPLHLQPAYSYMGHTESHFPVSEKCSKSILSLPFYPEMTDEEMYYVAENIKSFYAAKL